MGMCRVTGVYNGQTLSFFLGADVVSDLVGCTDQTGTWFPNAPAISSAGTSPAPASSFAFFDTLDTVGATEIAFAVAVLWAMAWGLRQIRRVIDDGSLIDPNH